MKTASQIKIERIEKVREVMVKENIPIPIKWHSSQIALRGDEYLLDLMEDWAIETNEMIKAEMLQEIANYSDEIYRLDKLKG